MRTLEGKTALVTGASSGIGRVTALALAAQGARLVLAARRGPELEQLAAEVAQAGGEALVAVTDVRDETQVRAAVDAALRRFGALQLVFNNAGIEGEHGRLLADMPLQAWQDLLATNLTGVFLCMKHSLPALKQQGGAIVNMSSVAALCGVQCTSAYAATKAGVIALTRAAAVEYAHRKIRVNAVAPGVIPTPMTARSGFLQGEMQEHLLGLHPMRRFGTAEEVAAAVVWLLSDQASFITGQVLAVDGGLTVP